MTEAIASIRAAHKSARPNPVSNPAWANTHHDLGVVLSAFEAQSRLVETMRDALASVAADKGRVHLNDETWFNVQAALEAARREKS